MSDFDIARRRRRLAEMQRRRAETDAKIAKGEHPVQQELAKSAGSEEKYRDIENRYADEISPPGSGAEGLLRDVLNAEQVEEDTDPGPGYGRCRNCQGQEPYEVLEWMEGFCTSECAEEYRAEIAYEDKDD